ncbi:hypothetical protein AAVH_24545 [Aphelenchoides avenae]|nr:hypothetical protein AAVH_24545 [Aphelenchus avenae]
MLSTILVLLGLLASGCCLTCHYYEYSNEEVVKDQVVTCTTTDAKFCFTVTMDGYDKEGGEVKIVMK